MSNKNIDINNNSMKNNNNSNEKIIVSLTMTCWFIEKKVKEVCISLWFCDST